MQSVAWMVVEYKYRLVFYCVAEKVCIYYVRGVVVLKSATLLDTER